MSATHFISLSPSRAIFLRETRTALTLSGSFIRGVDDGEALARFQQLLQRYPKDTFVFIVDTVNEEMVVEPVPPLRPRDLRQMMKRRIESRGRERRLTTWRTNGRRPLLPARATPGLGAVVVVSTLTVDGGLQAWLDAAVAAQVRIAEVLSPALLAASVARRLRRDAPSGLLVTVQPGGLRQTLVVDGLVKFTRIARLAEEGATSASIAAECTRTVQYLLMNQLLARETLGNRKARVWIVTDGISDPNDLPARLSADSASEIEVRRIRAAELGARRLKGTAPSFLGASHLWADNRLVATVGAGYATPTLRVRHVGARIARAIVTVGVALLTASVVALAGVELWVSLETQPVDPVAQHRLAEHEALAEILQRYPVPGTEMRRVVERDRALRQRALDAVLPLQRLARALDEVAEVTLERLSWDRGGIASNGSTGGDGDDGAVAATVVGAPASNALPGAAPDVPPWSPAAGTRSSEAEAGAAAPFDATSGATDPADFVMFRIEARVEPLTTKRAANASAAHLVDALARQCGCAVTLVTPPFDPSPATGFSADLKTTEGNQTGGFVATMQYPSGARRAVAR